MEEPTGYLQGFAVLPIPVSQVGFGFLEINSRTYMEFVACNVFVCHSEYDLEKTII